MRSCNQDGFVAPLNNLCAIAIMALIITGAASAQTPEIQTGTGHPFAAADYTAGKIFLIGADGKVEWEYDSSTCDEVWVLANGNIMFNTGHGVREVTRDKQTVFNYESPSEIYGCQRLENGNTFIAECNSGRLLTVDPKGAIVREVRLLPEGQDGGHTYMRNARLLPNGNYLVAHCGAEIVKEYDPEGKLIREIPAPGGPHTALRLANGNTLISCGDLHKQGMIIEVNPDGKIVWQVKHDELPGISLKFMAGLHRLPNENTVMCNWLGHDDFGKAPHLIEITPDKKVVWTYQDHATMKTIASVQILDIPGDPAKGELIH